MKNKSLVNNLQSFILLINKFLMLLPVLSMLILMCKIGEILLFFFWIKSGRSLNFWIKHQIFKNSSVKKIMNQIYINAYFVEIQA